MCAWLWVAPGSGSRSSGSPPKGPGPYGLGPKDTNVTTIFRTWGIIVRMWATIFRTWGTIFRMWVPPLAKAIVKHSESSQPAFGDGELFLGLGQPFLRSGELFLGLGPRVRATIFRIWGTIFRIWIKGQVLI